MALGELRLTEPDNDAFCRGLAAGRVESRLDAHARQLEAINVSVKRTGEALTELTRQVQRLGDQAVARHATVLTTAEALKQAEDARRDRADRAWAPVPRLQVWVTVVTSLVGVDAAHRLE